MHIKPIYKQFMLLYGNLKVFQFEQRKKQNSYSFLKTINKRKERKASQISFQSLNQTKSSKTVQTYPKTVTAILIFTYKKQKHIKKKSNQLKIIKSVKSVPYRALNQANQNSLQPCISAQLKTLNQSKWPLNSSYFYQKQHSTTQQTKHKLNDIKQTQAHTIILIEINHLYQIIFNAEPNLFIMTSYLIILYASHDNAVLQCYNAIIIYAKPSLKKNLKLIYVFLQYNQIINSIQQMEEDKHRIAIVNKEKCKPKRCKQQCKKGCPVNKTEKICIEVTPISPMVEISEILCVGCGICVKKCPFQAIKIINVPKNMDKLTTHRYGKNAFKLHRLPTPRPGQILGLVGINGIGKSTALLILGNQLKPNLGRYSDPPEWKQILKHFKGSQLQNYLSRMLQQNLKPARKPQFVDNIKKKIKGKVGQFIKKKDLLNRSDQLKVDLQLQKLYDRDIEQLSGGQLQRFAMMIVLIQKAQIYIFDEPTSYLDVKQRIKMAKLVRSVQTHDNYIIVVEHDLSILDYLSDFICCLYGQPAAYGVVTMPFTVREGINIFLAGFVPTENMRFRDQELTFKISDTFAEQDKDQSGAFKYPKMYKKIGDFQLQIEAGSFKTSQITVMLGENGTGKTTFIKMLSKAGKKGKKKLGEQKQVQEDDLQLPQMNVSYKPQTIDPTFEGTVRELLFAKAGQAWLTATFISQVTKPLRLDNIIDNQVQKLSGGQLQRVAIILALAKGADTYLIDEPSAYLDSQQRIICAKVIKRFILNNHKSAFIVEHDFIMSTYLADQVIVYEGEPGVKCKANTPQGLIEGMNKFLSMLQITFRRDSTNNRPRINKMYSVLDKEQKTSGNYFCNDD